MLNTKLKTIIFISALFTTPAIGASALGAGEHALFQIFFNEGSKPFPETVKGKHIEEKMHHQGFDIMLSAQSAGLHNDDVWTLQSNTFI
ncbi:MAG TPA: hypothetical protein EYG66_01390 [Mariprofundaceae bacterium]|nr:hypothetical protein [Mariprofundaceae bacterium]